MSARLEKKPGDRSPLVKVRQMVIVITGIAALLIVPLLLVWKQTYIRGSSVRLETMADTLSMLDKELSMLQFKAGRLSSIERIEAFAKTSLDLDYPSSDRMVIVSMDNKNKGRSRNGGGGTGEFLAAARTADRVSKGGPQ